MAPQERKMWEEYLQAIKPGARPGSLEAWARKYEVKVVGPAHTETTTKLETPKTVTKPVPEGTPPVGGGSAAAENCTDVCSGSFTSTSTFGAGRGATTIESSCKMSACASVCSGTPKTCHYNCKYRCNTTATSSF